MFHTLNFFGVFRKKTTEKLTLPPGIVVSSSDLRYRFDKMGQVESPGFVTLALIGSVPKTIDIQIN